MTTTNNTFSMARFSSLMKKYLLENWKVLLMRLLLMAGVLTVISCCIAAGCFSEYDYCLTYDDNNPNGEISSVIAGSMMLCLFVFGCMNASLAMESLKSKTGRISTFMTPASQLEKYLVRWIIAVPCFIILYIVCCEIADLSRCGLTLLIHPEYSGLVSPIDWYDLTHFTTSGGETHVCDGTYVTIYSFLVLQSFYVLGSAVWPKNSLLKTFVALAVLNTVFGIVFALGIGLMDGRHLQMPFRDSISGEFSMAFHVFLPVLVLLIMVFNYTVAYYRLKEMEIINRM